MSIVYIPKTIETVEGAEALPDGTMARKDDFDGWIDLAVKGSRGWARVDSSPTDRRQDDAMIGWTALIPVEAEEDGGTRYHGGDVHSFGSLEAARVDADEWIRLGETATAELLVRLVTPWRPASS